MRNRVAFTLVELSVTMSATCTLLLLAIGLVHRSLHAAGTAQGRAKTQQSLNRLSDQFRQDVSYAKLVEIESVDRLRLLTSENLEITYSCQADHCVRIESRPDGIRQKERYCLGEYASAEFRSGTALDGAEFLVIRRSESPGIASRVELNVQARMYQDAVQPSILGHRP